jgi:hypothetical protein
VAGGTPGAEATSQFEVLALGGFEGLPQGLGFVGCRCLSVASWAVRVRTTLLGESSGDYSVGRDGWFCR